MIERSLYPRHLTLLISASQRTMMTNVHLAGDGDMYSGFGREDVAPALDTADLEFDSGFQVRIVCIITGQVNYP